MTHLPNSKRHHLLILVAVLLAAMPVIFGFVRAINTGDDFRYLWLAASAIVGSSAAMVPGHHGPGPTRVSLERAVGAIAAGAGCAAATAVFLGATAGPGVALVAGAFGLCTGTSMILGTLARRRAMP